MNYHGLPAITVPIRDSWEDFKAPEAEDAETPSP